MISLYQYQPLAHDLFSFLFFPHFFSLLPFASFIHSWLLSRNFHSADSSRLRDCCELWQAFMATCSAAQYIHGEWCLCVYVSVWLISVMVATDADAGTVHSIVPLTTRIGTLARLHCIRLLITKRNDTKERKKDINDEANERPKQRTNYKWYTDWYEFHACSSINPCVCVGVALCTYRSARLCVCECGAWIERFAHQPSRVEMGKKARGKNSNVYMAQRTMAFIHSAI